MDASLYNILDLKMGIRPQKTSFLDSEIAQDVLEQTGDFPRRPEKCYASLYQIQSVI